MAALDDDNQIHCADCDLDWDKDDCPTGNDGHICPVCHSYMINDSRGSYFHTEQIA